MHNTLYDQHLHSSFSYDADKDSTIEIFIDTAMERGIAGIAVTDHYDPLWPTDNDAKPSVIDLTEYKKALMDAETYSDGRISFAKGIELGFIPGDAIEMCENTVKAYPYDFVIGSVHYTEKAPLDHPLFLEGRSLKEILEEYYTVLFECIKVFKNYDVLGHVNCIDRYTNSFAPQEIFMTYVDEILKVAIKDGKGIEINTSAFRYGLGERGTPTQLILNRYKELGGEIVTIGSDAHQASDVGSFIKEGEEMLLASGLRYIAVFKERRPNFIKL